MLSPSDLETLVLTFKVASIATAMMLLIGTPLAWWLARTHSGWKGIINAVVALPLVLPPTVLGFYLLVLMGPAGAVGKFTSWLGLGTLPFTFTGLVIASVLYSMPFVVQPLQASFTTIGEQPLEAAATLRASPLDTFFSVIIPLAKPGFLTASILGFAHTVGEFGVVLMVGGNIPGKTRVVSVQIYNHVEALEYSEAHWLAGCLLLFSFTVLIILYTVLKTQPVAHQLK
ncbi:MAG: molybdate ABC transporter permease subunit [Methylococcaceae bacterium]|nr:molybdate ABC transporter permease subunit [Methylococcaceae bacterium]MDZ4156492.1 molybdate ABC transporter permease subunit [Methylococcales bacterium]MDP2391708.1 molybdate ABC transporter permease subunit [Methylococcaceae bacterium]MDP3018209.1 molybdate ABC transporter permease subunit [Methylococcaceae bacterium]MDP3389420.1 molybdate ABC transporter permease subunit [Methylococcaceae bacterium]